MQIPYKYNPLGITKSSFSLDGLIFYAPLQEDYTATGGTHNNTNTSFVFNSDYAGKKCLDGSTSSGKGPCWDLENPIYGNVPFTFSVQLYYNTTTAGNYNNSIFYIGKSTEAQVFGYQIVNTKDVATAWGKTTWDGTSSGSYSFPTAALNTWVIFTATYNTSTNEIKHYYNGVLTHTGITTALNITKSTGVFFGNYGDLAMCSRGGDSGDGGRTWKGGMRNFFIFDYCMNDNQVQRLYNYSSQL